MTLNFMSINIFERIIQYIVIKKLSIESVFCTRIIPKFEGNYTNNKGFFKL